MNIRHLRNALFHRWLLFHDIRFFNPHTMLFDLGGTAKSQSFAHVRAHRRPVHGSLALDISQVHRLVMIFKIPLVTYCTYYIRRRIYNSEPNTGARPSVRLCLGLIQSGLSFP